MRKSMWQYFDWGLLLLVVVLTIFGLAMIYSATLGVESIQDTWRKQAVFGAVGVAFMLFTAAINYRLLESLQWPLYGLVLGSLAVALIFGDSEIGGVRRFIVIAGTSIQPAFPGLILLIVSQAGLLGGRATGGPDRLTLIVSLGMTTVAMGMVYLQPNLSTATLYLAVWVAMVFVSGINLAYIGGMGAVGVFSLPIVWSFLSDYMKKRVTNFLNPENDPAAYYNIMQALISIGSGGLWGKGFAAGTQSQSHFLRVRHTDFIFSVVCEELGFVGAALLLLLFALLLFRLLRIAANAGDMTGRLIVVGITTYIFYQLIVNVGMNLNVIPVAGLPMPFVSSGGSGLVVTFVGLGLVESVAMRHKRLEF